MRCLILLFLFVPALLFSQEKAKFADKLEGTYQIEFLKTAMEPIAVTNEILEKIEAIRKEDQTVYLTINEKTRIKVFSRKTVKNIDKTKQQEYVVVEKFINQ
ncbi:hypothetical protein ABGT15_14555 [Flavobacterium enshiense]|uniref:hypothetical protein n=1 Tax=Flavobacterium enshiense TaxID=1341165 RepID=UPI00345CCD0B